MTDKQIEFIYDGEGEPDEKILPTPAQEEIPAWFMRTPAIFDPGSKTGTTVKLCRAFTDALHMGYLIPAPEDITIDRYSDFTLDSDSDAVHIYGPSDYRGDGNSVYPIPELKIENPWRIRTPDGYSTLITKPTNRSFKGFEPNSMFVPTDQYEGPINVPAVMGQDTHEIKKGEPLAHVIPLKREEVLKPKNVSTDDVPELTKRCRRIRRQLDSRKDLYRKVHHQEKPASEITVEEDATADLPEGTGGDTPDPTEGIGKRSETHDEHFLFLTKSNNYGVTPGPYEAIEKAPPWIDDLEQHLDAPNTDGVSDEQLFQKWMRAACSMGAIDVVPTDIHFDQAGEYEERNTHSKRYDKTLAKPSMDEKIGPEFPFDFKITGCETDRFVVGVDGYSTLMTDPLNHYAQYVRGFQGVVDHDVYYDVTNMPSMMYTKNPEFEMKQGDPLFQAITFRRDSMITDAVVKY